MRLTPVFRWSIVADTMESWVIRKVIPFLPLLAVLALGATGANRSTNLKTDLYEMFAPGMMPAPDDTISYDDSLFFAIDLADSASRYWAVLFQPGALCSLKFGMVGIYQVGAVPECSLFVWPDSGGLPGDPPLFQTTFSAQGLPGWNDVMVTPPLVASGPFWVGYWLPNQGPDTLEQDLPACDSSSPGGSSYVSGDRLYWESVSTAFPGYYDLAIRAWVGFPAPAVHDVEPTRILALPESVFCDSGYVLGGEVHNRGDTVETFGVVLEIDTTGYVLFADTAQVMGLGTGAYDTVSFNTFWAPSRDGILYGVLVYTALPGDDSTGNDSLSDSAFGFCISVRDVGPVARISPPDTGFCDSVYEVRAEIANYGDTMETDILVEALIDSGGLPVYGDTLVIDTLLPGDTIQVTFTPWLAPPVDSLNYGVRYTTLLAPDANRLNDTLWDTTFIYCLLIHDVGVTRRVSPPDSVVCWQDYPVWVEVANQGDFTEDFDVICAIMDSNGVPLLRDTVSVLGLGADSSDTAAFGKTFTVPFRDGAWYNVVLCTELVPDANPSNDTLSDTICAACLPTADRDVAVVAIVAPPDTVLCDSTVHVRAYVRNLGTNVEFFNVECIVDSGEIIYADTASVPGLLPGDSMLVGFLDWDVPFSDSTWYTMIVRTLLAADTVYENDTLSKPVFGVCAFIHDVGILNIVDPPDTVFADSTYTPRVDVHNWGNQLETFEIVCTIDGYADSQVVSDLEPGWSVPVFFRGWDVGSPGTFTMDVLTMLAGDINALNDSASKAIEAITGIGDEYLLPVVPLESSILQSIPNPLSSFTCVYYQVAEAEEVNLSVYDLCGRAVKTLSLGRLLPGYYSARWDGCDEFERPVPSGVYVCKLRVGKVISSEKLVVVR
jgi:hypothetical protein